MKNQNKTWTLFVHLFMSIAVVICIFPVVWMIIISLKTVGESIGGFHSLSIQQPTLTNYQRLLELVPLGQNLFNSLFTTILGTLTTLFFCALAGFAFAKYEFPGKKVLFYFVIATMMITPEIGSVPLFIIMRKIGMINSLWSLIIPRIATAVGIFYMKQYITDVPTEIIEAARIDGCKDFSIFLRIILPVIKPALAAWASLTVIARWNDFFWPLLFLRKSSKYTLMVSVSMLPVSDGLSTPWQVVLAGTALVVIPSILMYLILQASQKSGLMAGAVKG